MVSVKKICHAVYETPDLAAQTAYYTDIIGLTQVEEAKGEVYLTGTIEHHSIVLRQGDDATCTAIGFQVANADELNELEKHVQSFDIKTERKSDSQPGTGDMLIFNDAKGTRMEVYATPDVKSAPFTHKGITPNKLGHLAFSVDDVQKNVKFYCDVLGFRESDWMADFFAFLRCGPDHHTINLVGSGGNVHHHTAFELRDWNHIQSSTDYLSREGYRLIWGPGRHGVGHNLFTYHKGPNGLVTELFAELDQMLDEELGYFEPRPWHRDMPQRPKVWPKGPDSANYWGPPPPEEMLKL